MNLWDLLTGVPIRYASADLPRDVTGAGYDSHTIRPGQVFVAIHGANADGHDYTAQARQRGAACAVSAHPVEGLPYVLVPDPRRALALMAGNFFRHPDRELHLIGITGTNGKTSTTEMTSEMLTACGLDAPTAGNIASGDMSMSLSRCATNPQHDVLCVELSSFQLHFTDSLALDCAAITNIADDHLDWHGGRENYAADKSKVFHNAKRAIVYNAQDAKVSELAAEAQTAEGCRKVGFTLEAPQAGQIGIEDGWIVDRSGVAGGAVGESVRLAAITDFTHLAEPDGSLYPHLVADALTALALVLGLGADRDTALKALTSFKPGGHRIETVAEAAVEGGSVRFVDDSKATNGHAARASLSSFPAKSVIWIAGGLAKGSRFEDLVKDQAHTIKAAVIIGKDQQPMIEAFASQAPDIPVTIIDPEDNDTVMDRAVEACGTYTAAGDIVLMAPACASMDQFKSYADRGNRFAAAAKTWSEVHGLH